MLKLAKKTLILWLVGAPMLLAIGYYALFAADRFVSESVVTVRQSGDNGAVAMSGIAMLLTGTNPPAREETLYLLGYIHSLDMLKHLDAKFDLRAAYATRASDPLYNLFAGASQEWFLRYYRNRVEVYYDDITGLLSVRVEAFEPELARAINAEILAQSERFVNEISHRVAREQMAFADNELATARQRLESAKTRLVAFQNRYQMFDPLAQAQAAATLNAQLEGEIAHKEAELNTLLGYMQADASQVVDARNRIAAYKAQLQIEHAKPASGNGGRLSNLAADYQNLILEAGFAEDAYKSALTAVESTRIEASRKLKSLILIEAPARAETALYPRRLYNLATLLVVLSVLFGIARLVIATIEDHRD